MEINLQKQKSLILNPPKRILYACFLDNELEIREVQNYYKMAWIAEASRQLGRRVYIEEPYTVEGFCNVIRRVFKCHTK